MDRVENTAAPSFAANFLKLQNRQEKVREQLFCCYLSPVSAVQTTRLDWRLD